MENVPLYSSRIIKTYVEYLKEYYPEVDIVPILEYAEMRAYDLEDQGHWFSQRQIDRFHEALVEKLDNPNISRDAGRYAMSSKASSILRQYATGFMTIGSAYSLGQKIAANISRATTFKTRNLGDNKIELTSTPKQGVHEKPYQCENRIGQLEALAKVFTKKYANVEHPTCIHKGGDCCRYIISWEKTPSLSWKLVRNYSLLLSILVSVVLFFVLPPMYWTVLIFLCGFFTMVFSSYSDHLEKKELANTIKTQGDAAKDLLDEMNIRYNDALLIQEIGQASSTILNIDKLINTVVSIMEKRMDFDRGMIMLANEKKTRLTYIAGYGYSKEQEELLQQTKFHLDKSDSKGTFVLAFKEQRPFLVNDISEIEKDLSERSQEFAKQIGGQ
ncbi:MAG: phosphohydrolase, partial [Deltaproteobacteria bacterium]|nr:phosphohydrolase [Deltaproteobacteria bacterium]